VAAIEAPHRNLSFRRRTRDPKEFVAAVSYSVRSQNDSVAAPVIPKSLWRVIIVEEEKRDLPSPHP